MSALFRDCYFIPTKERLLRLQHADKDLSTIAPYVNRLSFVSAPYDWTKDRHFRTDFRRFAFTLARDEYQLTSTVAISPDAEKLEDRAFLALHLDHDGFTVLNDRINRSYETYCQKASDSQAAWESQELEEAWVDTLRVFPGIKTVRIMSNQKEVMARFQRVGLQSPDRQLVSPTRNSQSYWPLEEYYRCSSPPGQALFVRAVACLGKAGLRARRLEANWKTRTDEGFCLTDLSSGSNLAFSSLQSFVFTVTGNPKALADVLDLVVGESADTLEVLEVETGTSTIWPNKAFTPLPRLRHFRCRWGTMNPNVLASWISSAPCLESVELSYIKPMAGRAYRWKGAFDALRSHSNIIGLKIQALAAFQEFREGVREPSRLFTLDLHANRGDGSHEVESMRPGHRDWDVDQSLSLYLQGKGVWDEVLRDVFDAE